MRELEFHQWLQTRSASRRGVLRDIGDDCAVIPPGARSGSSLLLTTDTIVGGIDFHCPAMGSRRNTVANLSPAQVGRKALAISLSDVAAMGCLPACAVVSLALPKQTPMSVVKALYRGIEGVAAIFRTAVVGGDYSDTPGPAVITTSVLGFTDGAPPVTRAGARPDDILFVTGALGGSILRKHWAFTPRIAEGSILRTEFKATAMMDISDGLALDLWRLARMSRVGATIAEQSVPVSLDARRLANRSGRTPLDHALHDGEDFELLFTLRPTMAARLVRRGGLGTSVTAIGRIERAPGLRIRSTTGDIRPLEPSGYVHGQ